MKQQIDISAIHSSDQDQITGFMAQAGKLTMKVDIIEGDHYKALTSIDNRLELYQDRCPNVKLIEVCTVSVIQVMNGLLKDRELQPVDEVGFDFAETLFRISNPVLAKQMGLGLVIQ